MTPEQKKLVEHMLSALEAPSRALTRWESNFIESLTEQYDEKNWMSDKQVDVLKRIYAEKT